jgi:hypothetical protein
MGSASPPRARATGETRMYTFAIAFFSAATIFVPSFIGIRSRTNSNWRSL